jgi:ribonuclease R
VHIADVSHYVPSGGELDREAFKRSFSVYPPGGVVPMLPAPLSSAECSLLEGQDRRSFSVLLDYDSAYRLRSSHMIPSVVRSRARLSYGEAQELMSGGRGSGDVAKLLLRMKPLLAAFREQRTERGTLDLDTGEVQVSLDGDGRPSTIARKRRLDSHDLVEECMIAANRSVAEKLSNLGWPAVYRIHGKPSPDSIDRLAEALGPLGYPLPRTVAPAQLQLQGLLDRVKGTPHSRLVSYLVLRSLPKALYSATNKGHYGLALDRYLHFTSPIRRYPDLVVHRFLRAALQGRPPGDLPEEERLADVADACSFREAMALEAEREVEAVYVTAYMRSRVGETFTGVVVGVEPFGVFVELDDLPAQGMVPTEDFGTGGGFRRRRGRRPGGHRVAELGQELTVRVVRADVARRQVEFSLA